MMGWKPVVAVLGWWALWPFAVAHPVTPSAICWVWAAIGASLTLMIWPQLDWLLGAVARALANVEIIAARPSPCGIRTGRRTA